MLSGHADAQTAVQGMEMGAFDYLLKPTDIEDMVYKIEDAHAKKRLQEERIAQRKLETPFLTRPDPCGLSSLPRNRHVSTGEREYERRKKAVSDVVCLGRGIRPVGPGNVPDHPQEQKTAHYSGPSGASGHFVFRGRGRRSVARDSGRQESLQPGILHSGYFPCLHPHRPVCRTHHRLHRRGRRIHHHACAHERRHQGHSGSRNRPVPHFRQGHHGHNGPQEAGQRLGGAGCRLSGRLGHRGYRRRRHQPRPVRGQPGAVRHVHQRNLCGLAGFSGHLCHVRLFQAAQGRRRR